MQTLIYVRAVNDVNGNPRCGWIVTWMDNLFIQEGYNGRWSLYKHMSQNGRPLLTPRDRFAFDRSVNEIILDITVTRYNILKRGM